jgi:hypothetical protein
MYFFVNASCQVSIRLNTFQNELIIVQVMVDTVIVSFTAGALTAAIFSMNITNGLEAVYLIAFWGAFLMLQILVICILTGIEKSLRSSGIVIGQSISGSVA